MSLSLSAPVLVAGGGIAGLAVAGAVARSGRAVQVLEQAPAFGDVGAGLQLGPNAVRVLDGWGLGQALRDRAAQPERLRVLEAATGRERATRSLADCPERYGAPYLTLQRSALHGLLCDAARSAGASLQQGIAIKNIAVKPDTVLTSAENGLEFEAPALLGCDGLWSRVREHLLGDGPPRRSGHLAYRAMLPAERVPELDRQVTVWLGPCQHAVAYPAGGGLLNAVLVVHGSPPVGDAAQWRSWNQPATAQGLAAALGRVEPRLQALVQGAESWRLWVLHDRPPLAGAADCARGRIALLGDAAHPMRPYLAQGAAMALEDAEALAQSLRGTGDWPAALRRYAEQRWARNARVQKRSQRNGRIFHATGPLRWARNLGLRVAGPRLLDQPWLYGAPHTFG